MKQTLQLIHQPSITLIAAMSGNYVIGSDNALPWDQPKGLKHFRTRTQGKPVIMGRKTFESIGKPLPNRHNIVVTRNKSFSADYVTVANSINDALKVAGGDEVMVIGGETIYNQVIEHADAIELTLIHKEVKGDAFFPDFTVLGNWAVKRMSFAQQDQHNASAMTFMRLERTGAPKRRTGLS